MGRNFHFFALSLSSIYRIAIFFIAVHNYISRLTHQREAIQLWLLKWIPFESRAKSILISNYIKYLANSPWTLGTTYSSCSLVRESRRGGNKVSLEMKRKSCLSTTKTFHIYKILEEIVEDLRNVLSSFQPHFVCLQKDIFENFIFNFVQKLKASWVLSAVRLRVDFLRVKSSSDSTSTLWSHRTSLTCEHYEKINSEQVKRDGKEDGSIMKKWNQLKLIHQLNERKMFAEKMKNDEISYHSSFFNFFFFFFFSLLLWEICGCCNC